MRLAENEGRLRSLLAVAILGCVGLAAWTGGCGRDTIVQPDASSSMDLEGQPDEGPKGDSGPVDGAREAGDGQGAGDVGNRDVGNGDLANEDAQAMACCGGNEAPRCLDSTHRAVCGMAFMACQEDPGLLYGHAWFVQDCPSGCHPATRSCLE
jgi:hypothetical protein